VHGSRNPARKSIRYSFILASCGMYTMLLRWFSTCEFLRAKRLCYCLNRKELIKNRISSSRELIRQKIRTNKFASGKQALQYYTYSFWW
jgi:hypothetical protein